MLKTLREHISEWRRQDHSRGDLARRLMALLDLREIVPLDASLEHDLSATRRQLMRVACDLVIREWIHLREGGEGAIELMSNAAFIRFMIGRADMTRDADVLLKEGECFPVDRLQQTMEDSAAITDETVLIQSVDVEEENLAGDELVTAGMILDFPGEGEEEGLLFTATPESASTNNDLDWFHLEVSSQSKVLPLADNPGNLPVLRQSLPDRKREPWMAFEVAVSEEK